MAKSNLLKMALIMTIGGSLIALGPVSGQQRVTDKIEHIPTPYVVVGDNVDRKTFLGWRVYHSTCYICHGVDATGTTVAPDLTQRVRKMTPIDFTIAVLFRYPIIVGFDNTGENDLPKVREAFLAEVEKNSAGELTMPAWNRDPNVKPHVMDLYRYLRARADGVLGTGRPQPMQEK